MSGLFPCQRFGGFGPTLLEFESLAPVLYQVAGSRAGVLRAGVRLQCPQQPCVYGMLDEHGDLIYIGKAKCLRTRLGSYFRPKSRDPKAGRILRHTRAIAWEYAPSEFAALLRELELIRRWQPRFNVQGQPGRQRRTFVCLGRKPAPHVFLARRPPKEVLASFGPIPGGQRAQEAVRRCNDWFRLRDCPHAQHMTFADQQELFPVLRAAGCLRHEIGTCLGPCAGACTRARYGRQVRAARAFLNGTDLTPLASLERDMAAASAVQAFERAAALRDRLTSLHWLHLQLDLLRRAQERHSFIYPVAGHQGQDIWYLIRAGRVEEAVRVPQDGAGRTAVAERIAAVFLKENAWERPGLSEGIDSLLLVASWFRRHPEEQAHTLEVADALTLCRGTALKIGHSRR